MLEAFTLQDWEKHDRKRADKRTTSARSLVRPLTVVVAIRYCHFVRGSGQVLRFES